MGQVQESEAEVSALQRRCQLVKEDLERSEERLGIASEKLEEASKAADESGRGRKVLENLSFQNDERIAALELSLQEAQMIAEDSDRKYDEASRRLAMLEVDLERAEQRADDAEAKIQELEEDLKVVGNNMKSLEVSEAEALSREESYEETIRDLSTRFKDAEARAAEGERQTGKLQKECDKLEADLVQEQEKSKAICDELERAFNELSGY